MSDVERNIANFTRFQQEVIVQGDFSHYDELVSPDAVTLRPANIEVQRMRGVEVSDDPTPMVKERFKASWAHAMKGRDDQTREIVEAFGSGDRAFLRWTITWTSTYESDGLPPTGETLVQEEAAVIRFDDRGRLLEGWFISDHMALFRQMGARIILEPAGVEAI